MAILSELPPVGEPDIDMGDKAVSRITLIAGGGFEESPNDSMADSAYIGQTISPRDISELQSANTGYIDISNNVGTKLPNARLPVPSRDAKRYAFLYLRNVF